MKKTVLFIFGFLMLASLGWGLFISQNCDPQANYVADRFAEIYNPSDDPVDLTGWTLENVQGGSVSFTWTLSGSIASGEALICGNADATGQTITPDFTATWVGNSWNGKGGDGTILKNASGTIIDNAVQADGTGMFENAEMVRNSNITTPTTTYNAAEWTFTSITNAVDATPGTHVCDLPVVTSPLITLSESTLTGFSYIVGNGPSSEQSFTAQGSNLTADITLTAPTNYEISETSGSGYTSPITLSQTGGSVTETTIYVRLKAGLTAGDYNNEDITATSTDADNKTVSCSGAVEAPATTTIPYTEVFTADLGECYTYNVSGATKEWIWDGGSAYMSGYNSGDDEEDWLILPGIDFDSYSDEILTFDTSYNYGTYDEFNYLKLYYSTDYSGIGNPVGSTWTEIAFTLPSATNTWTSSGSLDLSAISGTSVWLAFKYIDNAGTYRNWDVDNISITEVSNFPPEISNIVQTPASNIGTSTTVSVSADVTDSDGTISNVELHWGLVTGSLGTTIPMTLDTGSTYVTDTDIPAQSEGTTVYYEVYAVDNGTAGTTSDEASYFVTDAVEPGVGDLIINEVNSTLSANATYVELYNRSSSMIDLSNVDLEHYNNGAATTSAILNLTGTIVQDGYIVVTRDLTAFNTVYSFDADFAFSDMYLNGGTDGLILRTDTNGIIDQFNDVPSATVSWTDNTLFERTNYPNDGSSIADHWANLGTDQTGTPGAENDSPLPVSLSSFTAEYEDDAPVLYWTTQSETDNLGWNIYRSLSENGFDEDNYIQNNSEMIPGMGISTEPTDYSFIDEYPVVEGLTYWYWLESVSTTNELELHGPISLEIPIQGEIPHSNLGTALNPNYPNPFNPSTTISFSIEEDETGILTIYNIKGQDVYRQKYAAGEYHEEWNAEGLSSGIYFYRLQTPSQSITKKMILMK